MSYVRSTMLLTNPISPPTKDRWTTLNSMLFQSKAMKTITVCSPNQECIGSKLMCAGTAGGILQQRRNVSLEGCLCAADKGWFKLCIHIEQL